MVTPAEELLAQFRATDRAPARAHLSRLCPELALAFPKDSSASSLTTIAGAEGRWAAAAGVTRLDDAVPSGNRDGLAAAIERLTAASLPAMFVYLFDEPWALGEQIRARVSAMIGEQYELVEDVWAWRIPPGQRGWPPHRGLAEPLLDREKPELINTWVALSDVEVDRACMHFVPLDQDPSYPHALGTLDAPAAAVRSAPLAAGDALAWNANVLHWGGACSVQAKGARVSCSFSLARVDALASLGVPSAARAAIDLDARLDAVARQIETYGHGQPDVSAAVLEWARGANAMKAKIASLSERMPRPPART